MVVDVKYISGAYMDQRLIMDMLHPVRMRIMQELAAKNQCTSRQLGMVLPDVAQASLYRHLKAMLQDQILEVVSEKKVRGTVERTYRIKHNPFQELDEHGASLDNGSLLNLFFSFMLAQLRDCAEYLAKDGSTIEAERFGFRTFLLNISDEKLTLFLEDFRSLLQRYSQIEAEPGARLHKFSFSLIPDRHS